MKYITQRSLKARTWEKRLSSGERTTIPPNAALNNVLIIRAKHLVVFEFEGKRYSATQGSVDRAKWSLESDESEGVAVYRSEPDPLRWVEAVVIEALYQVSGQPAGESIQQALPVDRAVWEAMDRQEQHRILSAVVERITYDRRLQQGRLRLRPKVAGKEGEQVPIRAAKKPLVQQIPPTRREKAPVALVEGRVPRITKLMALAVRFEELLRQGTAKDYAELAQLGGVSRARITQVMNLRNLAPVLQERILSLPQNHSESSKLKECALRRITGIVDWREQIRQFEQVVRE